MGAGSGPAGSGAFGAPPGVTLSVLVRGVDRSVLAGYGPSAAAARAQLAASIAAAVGTGAANVAVYEITDAASGEVLFYSSSVGAGAVLPEARLLQPAAAAGDLGPIVAWVVIGTPSTDVATALQASLATNATALADSITAGLAAADATAFGAASATIVSAPPSAAAAAPASPSAPASTSAAPSAVAAPALATAMATAAAPAASGGGSGGSPAGFGTTAAILAAGGLATAAIVAWALWAARVPAAAKPAAAAAQATARERRAASAASLEPSAAAPSAAPSPNVRVAMPTRPGTSVGDAHARAH